MKIVGIIGLLFLMLFGLSIGFDMLIGLPWKAALFAALNPFTVMSFPEVILLIVFILHYLISEIITLLKSNQSKKKKRGAKIRP